MEKLLSYLRGLFTETYPAITDSFFDGNIAYILIVLISLVLLFIRRKDLKEGHQMFAAFTLVSLLIIYNPLFRLVFSKIPSANDGVIARLWILCPFWLIVAYVVALYCSKISKAVVKYIAVLATVSVLILTGSTVRSLGMIREPSNIYKINEASVEIADEVLELNGGEPVSLMIFTPEYEVGENFIEGGTINEGMRQYTADVCVYAHRPSEEFWNDYFVADITPTNRDSVEYLNAYITEWHDVQCFDYFAVPVDEVVKSKLDTLQYELVSSIAGYDIYRMP